MQLSIELLDTENESPDDQEDADAAQTVKWTKYVDSYVNDVANDSAAPLSAALKQPKEEPQHLPQSFPHSNNPHQHVVMPAMSAGEDLNPLASEGQLLTLIGCGGIKADLSDDLKEHLKKKPVFLSRNIRQWKSRVRRRRDPSGNLIALGRDDRGSKEVAGGSRDPKKPGASGVKTLGLNSSSSTSATTAPTTMTTTMLSKATTSSSGIATSPPAGISPANSGNFSLSDLTVTDDIECKFTLGNFKMLYVVNSESYLYKHSSLLKAKKVRREGL